jgi:hypothetical protein
MNGSYAVHEPVSLEEGVETDSTSWSQNEYLDLELNLYLGEYEKNHKFMISFGFQNDDFTEIGTFTKTPTSIVHFSSYTQPGSLHNTKGNREGRKRDGKTWEGEGHFSMLDNVFKVRARRLFKNDDEKRSILEGEDHAFAATFQVKNW